MSGYNYDWKFFDNLTNDLKIKVSDIISNPTKFHDIYHDKENYSLMNETPWEEQKKWAIEKGYYKGK